MSIFYLTKDRNTLPRVSSVNDAADEITQLEISIMRIKFTLNIDSSNDAFQENPDLETMRVLKKVRLWIQQGDTQGNCRDLNGNTVGEWSLDLIQDSDNE